MEIRVVCEGDSSSLDFRLLDRILGIEEGLSAVRVEPAGGDTSLGAVRAYLGRSTGVDAAIAIEDRNYRSLSEAQQTWDRQSSSLIWLRHEIENYLLEPEVVLDALHVLAADPETTYRPPLPADLASVERLLWSVAADLLTDHAGELARRRLTQAIQNATAPGDTVFRPSPPATRDRAGWIASLQQEASRFAGACQVARSLPDLATQAIQALYDQILNELREPAFRDTGQFLLDLSGHSLHSALLQQLRQRRRRRNPQRQWSKPDTFEADVDAELVSAFAARYHDPANRPPEFVQLADRLRDLSR